MALPTGVHVCTIRSGRYFNILGQNFGATVTVTPNFGSVNGITWSATGEVMTDEEITGSAEAGLDYTVDVPVVDQAGWIDPAGNAFTMWSYTIVLRVGQQTIVKQVQPLDGQTSIDLDLIPTGASATPSTTPLAVVTSFLGLTGNITEDQLGDLVIGGGTPPDPPTTIDAEAVRDILGATVVAGSGITIVVNDAGDTITFALDAHTHTQADIVDLVTDLEMKMDQESGLSNRFRGFVTAHPATDLQPGDWWFLVEA